MLNFIADFGVVLILAAIFGLILCVFGILFESFVDTDKIAKWFDETVDDEKNDFID